MVIKNKIGPHFLSSFSDQNNDRVEKKNHQGISCFKGLKLVLVFRQRKLK